MSAVTRPTRELPSRPSPGGAFAFARALLERQGVSPAGTPAAAKALALLLERSEPGEPAAPILLSGADAARLCGFEPRTWWLVRRRLLGLGHLVASGAPRGKAGGRGKKASYCVAPATLAEFRSWETVNAPSLMGAGHSRKPSLNASDHRSPFTDVSSFVGQKNTSTSHVSQSSNERDALLRALEAEAFPRDRRKAARPMPVSFASPDASWIGGHRFFYDPNEPGARSPDEKYRDLVANGSEALEGIVPEPAAPASRPAETVNAPVTPRRESGGAQPSGEPAHPSRSTKRVDGTPEPRRNTHPEATRAGRETLNARTEQPSTEDDGPELQATSGNESPASEGAPETVNDAREAMRETVNATRSPDAARPHPTPSSPPMTARDVLTLVANEPRIRVKIALVQLAETLALLERLDRIENLEERLALMRLIEVRKTVNAPGAACTVSAPGEPSPAPKSAGAPHDAVKAMRDAGHRDGACAPPDRVEARRPSENRPEDRLARSENRPEGIAARSENRRAEGHAARPRPDDRGEKRRRAPGPLWSPVEGKETGAVFQHARSILEWSNREFGAHFPVEKSARDTLRYPFEAVRGAVSHVLIKKAQGYPFENPGAVLWEAITLPHYKLAEFAVARFDEVLEHTREPLARAATATPPSPSSSTLEETETSFEDQRRRRGALQEIYDALSPDERAVLDARAEDEARGRGTLPDSPLGSLILSRRTQDARHAILERERARELSTRLGLKELPNLGDRRSHETVNETVGTVPPRVTPEGA